MAASLPTRRVLGVDVAAVSETAALDFARDAALGQGQTVIHFLNAHNANLAVTNATYRRCISQATVFPDGIGLDIAGRILHGGPFPANLNGTDFVPKLLTTIETPLRIALVGARGSVLTDAARAFRAASPQHAFTPVADGYYDRATTDDVMAAIAAVDPHILIVAMGTPVQELWIADNVAAPHGHLVLSVGALFDFMAGAVPRAPQRWRRLRLEWVYRLITEPSRLWRRYILGNPLFIARVLASRFGLRRY